MKKLPLSSAIGIVLIVLLSLFAGCGGGGPKIANVECTVVGNSAVITWDTNTDAMSQVEYGTTIYYGTYTEIGTIPIKSHTVIIDGLVANTSYHCRVRSMDASGAESISKDYTFSIYGVEIYAVTTSSVTDESAVITWATDAPARSEVEYGTTTDYGSTMALEGPRTTSHSAVLEELIPNTTYCFRVKSTSSTGVETVSSNYAFGTLRAQAETPDRPGITGITGVAVSDHDGTRAYITWTTDVPTSNQVEYGTTTGYGTLTPLDGHLVTTHSVVIYWLSAGHTYHFRVKSKNSAGIENVSADYTFNTLSLAISNVSCFSVTDSTATIIWATNIATTSQVEYGTTTGYGTSTQRDLSMTGTHSVLLTGLAPNTTYQYRVKSDDGDAVGVGVATVSNNHTFTTLEDIATTAIFDITDIAVSDIAGSRAIIAWTTSVPATSQVEYGATPLYSEASMRDSTLKTSHSVRLTFLAQDTTYHFRILSRNGDEVEVVTGNKTFVSTSGQISSMAASDITSSGATITWNTAMLATGQVEYGTTMDLGEVVTPDTLTTTTHIVALAGLDPGTTYYYRVISKKNDEVTLISLVDIFTTAD